MQNALWAVRSRSFCQHVVLFTVCSALWVVAEQPKGWHQMHQSWGLVSSPVQNAHTVGLQTLRVAPIAKHAVSPLMFWGQWSRAVLLGGCSEPMLQWRVTTVCERLLSNTQWGSEQTYWFHTVLGSELAPRNHSALIALSHFPWGNAMPQKPLTFVSVSFVHTFGLICSEENLQFSHRLYFRSMVYEELAGL